MSQHEYPVIGYGIDVSNEIISATTSDGIKDLLSLCPKVKKLYFKDFNMDDEITLNYLNELGELYENTCQVGLHALISECVNELTGFWGIASIVGPEMRNEDCEAFVLYYPIYPWMFENIKVKNITKKELNIAFDSVVKTITEGKIEEVYADYFTFVNYC